MIELQDAIRNHIGVMIGHRDHPGAELDPRGPFRRSRDEQLWRAIYLHATGMMLAHPQFGETEMLQPVHKLEIPTHAERHVLIVAVMWGQEYACTNVAPLIHGFSPANLIVTARLSTQ
ncbi:hypothetical protein M2346_000550 [Sphingobium xanthum]|nr:hypothetical protein [Sphingobium sp. B10D3B]MCW2380868.1 hypothetical protein [Sphingobium sp. B2D3B]MCW2399025.1 hypothetical protein [Sphingobium sp. B2D3C]MCW2400530.1 hypothetical protein [Sphingobium sp. B10D7B]MCW2407509.1 hypothetical protein [Sphingobium xanthum]